MNCKSCENSNANRDMELKDTVKYMESDNFKERFKGEYYQLVVRMKGLDRMLEKYANGTLSFKPNCSFDLLLAQFKAMEMYKYFLEKRAKIENIQL